jgi:hypothetical protein
VLAAHLELQLIYHLSSGASLIRISVPYFVAGLIIGHKAVLMMLMAERGAKRKIHAQRSASLRGSDKLTFVLGKAINIK